MLIQKDGKALTDFSGTIPCKKVVIIDGKLLNIVTRKPKNMFRMVKTGHTLVVYKNGKRITTPIFH
jgi:hypothetical protein